jgi:hypothetical protein
LDVSADEWLMGLYEFPNSVHFFVQKHKLIFSSIIDYVFFGSSVNLIVNEEAT